MSRRKSQRTASRARSRASPFRFRLSLVLAAVFAAGSIYEPLHLLSELHYASSGVLVGPPQAAALDDPHHDPAHGGHHHGPAHEPHAAADHQRPTIGAGDAPVFGFAPAVLVESTLARDRRRATGARVIAATTTPPARAPPAPHQPRAPPLA